METQTWVCHSGIPNIRCRTQVWGGGAWAACYGLTPMVPGTAPPQPMQQQLVARATIAAAVASRSGADDAADVAVGTACDVQGTAGHGRAAAATAVSLPSGGQRRRQAAGADGHVAAAAAGCRGWWRPADPSHPHLQGVPGEFFEQLPP